MGYVACLGQIPEETAHVLQNLVSANGLINYIKQIIYFFNYVQITFSFEGRVRRIIIYARK